MLVILAFLFVPCISHLTCLPFRSSIPHIVVAFIDPWFSQRLSVHNASWSFTIVNGQSLGNPRFDKSDNVVRQNNNIKFRGWRTESFFNREIRSYRPSSLFHVSHIGCHQYSYLLSNRNNGSLAVKNIDDDCFFSEYISCDGVEKPGKEWLLAKRMDLEYLQSL